jgi:histidine triad (HIT) family protein
MGKVPAMSVSDPDCLFCKIVSGDIPATVVASDERTVTFMDINPATRGHALVVPRTHTRDLLEIDPEDLAAVAQAAQRLARTAKATLNADGINLINSCGAAAWQTVFHFHLHVIPRYADDPLRLPWVPAEGDMEQIRATGEALKESYA